MKTTVGAYLLNRLKALGVGHIFGIPGDFVLGFNKMIEDTPDIEFINTCDEQGAGFAADAYARLNGLGVVCITYCVGGLKVANPVAGAYAEKSPVIVISGSPGIHERKKNPLLHHKVKDFDTQKKIFDELTVASTVIRDAKTAKSEIDRVIQAALDQKRPVYIELPRDMVFQDIPSDSSLPADEKQARVSAAFSEALAEAVTMIRTSKRPAILADVEIHRFGLQEKVLSLAEHLNIPIAATVLGKSVIAETHPLYMGVYAGGLGNAAVREYIESSDCLMMLGVFMTDMNLGVFTANLDPSRAIYLTSDTLAIKHHHYDDIAMHLFIEGLMTADLGAKESGPYPTPPTCLPFVATSAEITIQRLFDAINSSLTSDMVVVADVGDALFGAMDLVIRSQTEFVSPAYYASVGFAVPASIGAAMACPHLRPLVIVGDGAFQMTGNELSTIARYGLNPIVIVLNNGGYGTERPMLDGKFNDVFNWNYSRLPDILNVGVGVKVGTEHDFLIALQGAVSDATQFYLIEVILGRDDRSDALNRLTQSLGARIPSGVDFDAAQPALHR